VVFPIRQVIRIEIDDSRIRLLFDPTKGAGLHKTAFINPDDIGTALDCHFSQCPVIGCDAWSCTQFMLQVSEPFPEKMNIWLFIDRPNGLSHVYQDSTAG